MTFFSAYKEYIAHHPERKEYIATSEQFDISALKEALKEIDITVTPFTQDDVDALSDFLGASEFLNDMNKEMYRHIKDMLPSLNVPIAKLCEYVIAIINRNLLIVIQKYKENLKKIDRGACCSISDLADFRIEPDDKQLSAIPIRGNMEIQIDFTCLILNYFRYFLDKNNICDTNADPSEFIKKFIYIEAVANIGFLFRNIYNNCLYEGGRIKKTTEGERMIITLSYDDEEKQKLIKAGDLLFSHRRMTVYSKMMLDSEKSCFFPYQTTFRIKSCTIQDGCIRLSFGQGRKSQQDEMMKEMDASIQAYYAFLDIHQTLPKLKDVTICDVLVVLGTIQYIAQYILDNAHFENGVYTSSDFYAIPCKIRKTDLIDYSAKMLTLKRNTIKQCVELFEATWSKPNNIWSTPIYPIGDYELLPFYPILFTSPYYVIDQILYRGGISLAERGVQFEKYIYDRLSHSHCPYEMKCLPARKYGSKGDSEEIDVLVGLKNVLLIADAKCIQYPMESINYHDAWKRLQEGAEQVLRKAEFVQKHPEYFTELGDYSQKRIIPFVLTNYPTYTGCNHNGVYVIDAPSFLAYMSGNCVLTRHERGKNSDEITNMKKLYTNENEFSENFEGYLKCNPQKQLLMQLIQMENSTVYKDKNQEWITRTAQFQNDNRLNICN